MNAHRSHSLVVSAFLLLPLAWSTACGGGGLSGPSTTPNSVVLNGSVVGTSATSGAGYSLKALSAGTPSISGAVSVSIEENPALSTSVSGDGSFTLRGLPSGSFTLVFRRDGALLGTLIFSSVLPNQELSITVTVAGGSVVLVNEQRSGIGHGDLEVEGRVEAVLLLNATGESRFMIAGRVVVARAFETAIREGNRARGVADLTVGRKVHVKGSLLPAEGSTQPLLASEIKLQDGQDEDDDDDEQPSPSPSPTPRASCLIEGAVPGRSLELEGRVQSGSASSFRLSVEGGRSTGPVDILAAGASLECSPKSGPNAPTPAQCSASVVAGVKVHVTGILDACSATAAQVSASRIIVQK